MVNCTDRETPLNVTLTQASIESFERNHLNSHDSRVVGLGLFILPYH